MDVPDPVLSAIV